MAFSTDITTAFATRKDIPPGITPEYLAQNRDGPAIGAILAIGILTFLLLLLRYYTRLFLVKSFGLDDKLALLSMVIYVTFMALSIWLIFLGSGRHIEYIQYVLTIPTTRLTEVVDFAAHILYTTALFVCRLSGLAFYRRICNGRKKFIIITNVAAGFLFIAYLPQVFLLIFHCLPVTGLWPYAWQPDMNNFICLQWGVVYVVNSAISLVCDLIMFSIPSMIINSLMLSLKKKILLALVLFPGVLVIIISCVRLYLVVRGQWEPDQSWYYDPMLAIENAEIGGTLIALSVPGLKPLFQEWFTNISTTWSGSSKSSQSLKHHRLIGANRSASIREAKSNGSNDTSVGTHLGIENEKVKTRGFRDGWHVHKTTFIKQTSMEVPVRPYVGT